MFNKKIKITKQEIDELKGRQKILNQQYIMAEALNLHVKLFTNSILKKYGLDLEKNYNINLDKGFIQEVDQGSIEKIDKPSEKK